MSWRCFFLEPVESVRVELRRYTSYMQGLECPDHHGGHDATVFVEDRPAPLEETFTIDDDPAAFPHDDPRWPARCSCGYEFGEHDKWQVWRRRLHRPVGDPLPVGIGPDHRFTLRDPPTGAMWYADWLPQRGPDGHCLAVQCPGGLTWMVDGPASNGPGWTRTGTVPDVTARPSIGAGEKHGRWYYHGWLTDGVLSDPLGDSAMLREA